jgi:hypothetical protein
MDGNNEVPVLVLHVLEADIAKNAGIVDQHIDTAKVLDGRVNDLVSVRDAIVVCYSLPASSSDLVNDDICSLRLTLALSSLEANVGKAETIMIEYKAKKIVPLSSCPLP